MKVGYTTGVFDMFHIGHLNLIKRAKALCDYLIVGVSSDALVAEAKKVDLFVPYAERSAIVNSVRYVDQVIEQTSYDKFAAWENLRFNIMFVGDDWKGTPRWIALEERFKPVDVQIVYFPYTENTSSTKLRQALNASIEARR